MKNHRSFLHIIKKRIGPVLLAAVTVLAAAGFVTAVSAAEVSSATAVIPVQQTVKNGSGTFSYVLTPEEEGSPMPEGSESGSFTLSLKDTAEGEIEIPCTEPGTWYYSLELQKSSDTGYTYDVTKYRIGVQCVSKDDGTYGTEITALADGASQNRKAKTVQFTITHEKSGTTTKKTHSGGGGGSTPSRTSTSSGSGKSGKSSRVKTGDTARTSLYFGMLAGAAALLVILGSARRKRDVK